MIKYAMAGAALIGALGVAACGAPSSTNAPTSTAPSTSTAPATTAPAPATAAGATGGVTLILDSSASQASYRARESLVGRALPNEAVGTTRSVSGTIVLDSGGQVVADQSSVTVDLSGLQSDESRRDNFIKGNTLNVRQFPTATFVPRSVANLPGPLPTSGQANFQLNGDLTVRGVTRPVSWQVTANFSPASVSGNATTSVQMTDFGMTPPKAGPVLSIEDQLGLELVFAANRTA
jgi:polyisoprenoid-binding protein YceI